MTLYLSQKALLYLFVGGFLVGVLGSFVYTLTDLPLVCQPRARWFRVLRQGWIALRDFGLFTLIGVADAILFFVYHSGRVRATVFVLNAVGFGMGYYLICRPMVRLIGKWLKKRFLGRSEDVV